MGGPDTLLGVTTSHYRILEKLGRGGVSCLRRDFWLLNSASAFTSEATISFLLMSRIVGLQTISLTESEDSAWDDGTAFTITAVSADLATTCAPGMTKPTSHAMTAELRQNAIPPEKHSKARRTRFLPGIWEREGLQMGSPRALLGC
jgi:hypothetical protein